MTLRWKEPSGANAMPGQKLQESHLEFDFTQSVDAIRYEDTTTSLPVRKVDFLVDWPNEVWLIEVKNVVKPSISRSHPDVVKFIDKFNNTSLFYQDLGPKLRDTFYVFYLHDTVPRKPLRYYALIETGLPTSRLATRQQHLKKACLETPPTGGSWPSPIVQGVALFDVASWNFFLPQCPVRFLP